MISLIFALAQVATPTQSVAGTRIEVDQQEGRFRVVLEEPQRTKIIPWQLESPDSGLPPRNVYVLVMNKKDEVVGCGADNVPHRAAAASSSSASLSELKRFRLKKGQQFVTPWHDVAPLFVFFDECVKPGRRGGYAKYKILMRIDTSSGYLRAETGWLDFPGYKTSAWESVLHPPQKP